MTHTPFDSDAARAATQNSPQLPSAVFARTADAPGMNEVAPEVSRQDQPDPSDEVLVDQAGRPLGPRALQTRRKILEAAVSLLAEKPMRDMRVIDIARQIGSSPATFYQYFKDVEDVVLHLAGQAKEATPIMVDLIGGDWEGEAGFERGKKISNLVIDHWEKFAPVLRARNNASDEGNAALREERMAAMVPLVDAFRAALERSQAKAAEAVDPQDGVWRGGPVDPLVAATALSSCLERTAMYHGWIEDMGSSREQLVETTAALLQGMLAVRR